MTMQKSKKLIAFLAAFMLLMMCWMPSLASAIDSNAAVSTTYGQVMGKTYDGGMCYLGIPYAAPTIGELRFLPPKAPPEWDGILDATTQPKDPIQNNYSEKKQSEDSLRLNIWVPDTDTDQPLAVMFWIYGGSYATGGINKMYYNMETMANETGCIIVSANYRLNVCGFIDLRDVIPGATVNNGLRDIVFALQWVHENIGNFGGNPDNVTVFGQSAGAALATALLSIPSADAYFDKIIAQSACGDSFYSPAQAKELTKTWMQLMDEPTAEELISMPAKQLVSCNSELDVKKFMKSGIDCIYNPVIDGEFLVCHPSQVKNTDKKVLLGCNKDEASLFLFFVLPPLTLIPFAHEVAMPGYSDELKASVTKGIGFPSTDSLITLTTERMYRFPLTQLADNLSQSTEVYSYRYDYESVLVKMLNLGSFHCTEIPVLFDVSLKLGPIKLRPFGFKADDAVGTRMRTYWGDFAKYGTPSADWTPYDAEQRSTMIINTNDTVCNDPYGERMALYETYIPAWNQ